MKTFVNPFAMIRPCIEIQNSSDDVYLDDFLKFLKQHRIESQFYVVSPLSLHTSVEIDFYNRKCYIWRDRFRGTMSIDEFKNEYKGRLMSLKFGL